jgi:hypothetical protein
MSQTGRPRVLDETKLREICALVSAGCEIREAARYVRCAPSTIRREAERNDEFRQRLDKAKMYADLRPLRAMQQAVGSHWRAAAWMLERTRPGRFARGDPRAVRPRQVRALANDLVDIIDREFIDPLQRDRIEKRIRAAVEYAIHDAGDVRRSGRNLRRAMQYFNEKEENRGPRDSFDLPAPDLLADAGLRPSPQTMPNVTANGAAEIVRKLIDRLRDTELSSPPDSDPASAPDQRADCRSTAISDDSPPANDPKPAVPPRHLSQAQNA